MSLHKLIKTLEVPGLGFSTDFPDLEEISEKLDFLNIRNRVGEVNWKDFSYVPEVLFSAGYTAYELLLKYYVTEDYFKAEKTESNQNVYEDSCVEFFVSPEDDGTFYNLEFNAIGTCLMGYGTGRDNRLRADAGIISRIRRKSSLGNKPMKERNGKLTWSITIAIPADVFFRHKLRELKGKTFMANFYKCGDKLAVPHYLTWNPVRTEIPDFHRPEFFGAMKFT